MSLLRILHVEDSECDSDLMTRLLEKAGLEIEALRVDDAESMQRALDDTAWDAIICDYRLPSLDAPRALEILRATGRDIPFIVVSGNIGEDLAVAMMRSGAHDYLIKDNLARLAPAVEREVREARARAERRETARKLRESQDRLALAIQTTRLGTFDYYVLENRLVWSDLTREMFGVSEDQQITGKTFWEIVHPDDRMHVRRLGTAAMHGKNGGEFSFEYRVIRKCDADLRWFSTWGRVLFEGGQAVRIIGVAHEITASKRAEEALRYQLDLTQCITQQTSDSIFVTDREGRVTFMNPEAERVFGLTSDWMIGRNLQETIHSRSHWSPIGTAGQTVRDCEDVLLRRDGTEVQASCSSGPLELNGEKIGVVVTIRDITERKRAERALLESEARFRRLAEAGVVGVVISDEQYILDANDYFISLLGHTRESFHLGSVRWRDITPPEHMAQSERAVGSMMKTGSAAPFEKEYLRRDGSRVPVLVGGVMIDYRDRRCFFAIVVDQTAHRNLEEQVRQSQKLDSLGQLAGGVAHDFNNLLTIILGYSQMIAGDLAATSPVREQIDQIVRAATRAAGLTRQLLTFSRQDQPRPRTLNLNHVVRDVESMLQRLLSENVKTELSLSEDAGLIKADPGQLEQVLVNLALNARDAMPGGGTIWIETAPLIADEFAALCLSIAPGEYVQLVVSDSGVGMTPEVQSRIFEPFFTTKGPDKGTGLGLSTVYGIVKQSGGTVSVHSGPGLGTTFRILFPATREAVPAEAAPERNVPGGGNGTILLVEDEDGVLQYVKEILTRAGYDVLSFNNAPMAIAAAASHPGEIDLLITDFILPGATGSEIIRRVLELRPGVPSLVMSGYTDRLGRRKEETTAYLQKPFSAGDLLAEVRSLIRASEPAAQQANP